MTFPSLLQSHSLSLSSSPYFTIIMISQIQYHIYSSSQCEHIGVTEFCFCIYHSYNHIHAGMALVLFLSPYTCTYICISYPILYKFTVHGFIYVNRLLRLLLSFSFVCMRNWIQHMCIDVCVRSHTHRMERDAANSEHSRMYWCICTYTQHLEIRLMMISLSNRSFRSVPNTHCDGTHCHGMSRRYGIKSCFGEKFQSTGANKNNKQTNGWMGMTKYLREWNKVFNSLHCIGLFG